MAQEKKLIFLDIDGTITMPGVPPSVETVSAIRAARENGHLVFLCTGRSPFTVDKAVSDIGFDGGIYYAGGWVYLNGETIFDQPIARERVLTLIRLLTEQHLILHLEAAQNVYSDGEDIDLEAAALGGASTELLRQMMQRRNAQSKPICAYTDEPVYKIGIISYSPQQRRQLQACLPEWAKLVWFGNFHRDAAVTAGEISDFAVTKATAMEAICRRLGYTSEDCIAFGDSMNDAEILKCAGIGVAMGNSDSRVKEIADQICEPCQENGIAKAFKRMKLIP
ncbi:MAG: HAD family hydrolase [Faecousia sp.]